MVVVGNFRNRAELRRRPRRHFNYSAKIVTEKDKPFVSCSIQDISEVGARLVLESEIELPQQFVLLLTPNGSARRHCRLIWREGLIAGVEFPQSQEQIDPNAHS